MTHIGFIGFDLDGTLAEYTHWQGIEHIGEPIEPMIKHLKKYLDDGYPVKIFTARACEPESIPYIEEWCKKHIGTVLPITNKKDYSLVRFYDDRAVAVEHNTGRFYSFEQYPIWK